MEWFAAFWFVLGFVAIPVIQMRWAGIEQEKRGNL